MADQPHSDTQEEHSAAHATCSGPAVLLVGGSGYLGQHLIATLLPLALDNKLRLGYTYTSSALPLPAQAQKTVWARPLRLQDDEDTHARLLAEFKPDVLVLLAAMSSPAGCEKDPEGALRVNAPTALLSALNTVAPHCLIVFLSTDQVYGGDVSRPYTEKDTPRPVNAYGRSKLACEEVLRGASKGLTGEGEGSSHSSSHSSSVCSPFVILRSSNMIGAPCPYRPQPKFLQWLHDKLAQADVAGPLSLFEDEVRSFVYTQDIATAIHHIIIRWWSEGRGGAQPWRHTFNMGGPQPMSRVQLGDTLCSVCGWAGQGRVVGGQRALLDAQMGFTSPLDISMDSSGLQSWLGASAFPCTPMHKALPHSLGLPPSSS